jgi:hypothetical protein
MKIIVLIAFVLALIAIANPARTKTPDLGGNLGLNAFCHALMKWRRSWTVLRRDVAPYHGMEGGNNIVTRPATRSVTPVVLLEERQHSIIE